MLTNRATLPYYYENEDEPELCANGVKRQRIWEYIVDQSAQTRLDDMTHPVIVEQVLHKVLYTFDDVRVQFSTVYEWHYLNPVEATQAPTSLGYRQYSKGNFFRGGKPALCPEVGLMLAFTPRAKELPPFIESVSLDHIREILAEAADLMDASSPINAWMSVPIDAPTTAPEDISHTMAHLRRELGVQPTRGRTRMLRAMMDHTGVTLNETGWSLTPGELVRRRRVSQAR